MTIPLLMRRGVAAVLLIVALVLQGTTSVLAGTTGNISGTVVDASTNQPVSGARITAQSPSQSATTTSDGTGRFTFLSLTPDTYTLSVAASAKYDAFTLSGITVFADTTQTVSLAPPSKLKTIGSVTSRANSSLVKPGTTADVYSISATTQDKAANLGGGGTLNSAWSAISSVPGVYVAPGQNGYIGGGATLSIRGGDYDQIGYELDGIPVNRAFDQYPSSSLSSLGQQELQVYTGATPANAEAGGISGYINQVIKTGTAPAYRSLDLAVGTPAFYNRLAFETGGANPSRTFSYYVGAGWYNQNFRYVDQFNGASLSRYNGAPLGVCPTYDPVNNPAFNPTSVPSCFSPNGKPYTNNGATNAYVLGPYGADSVQASTHARDTVANFHFGIPHKDGTKDDIQVLWDNNYLGNYAFSSTNDLGGAPFLNAAGVGPATWPDGYRIARPYGTVLPAGYTGGGNVAGTYLFPDSPAGHPFGSEIPYNQRSLGPNDQSILKAQYQHNFGTNAFLRVYGYTYYSDWLMIDPASYNANYLGFFPSDYELSSHTRGLSATFSDQITPQHLLSIQGSYTTSHVLRYNNSGIGFGPKTTIGYLVNGSDPYNGTCYSITGAPDPGCNYGSSGFAKLTMGQALNGGAAVPAAGVTCGTGPCQYALVAGGPSATYNTVTPKFSSGSITDNWRPTDKLNINLGLRFDRYEFDGADTTNSGARTLFYNAYNLAHPGVNLQNVSGGVDAYNEWQPRVGMTYSVDPRTVLRLSYGRYAEVPNSAFEQYNYLQPNDLSKLLKFGSLGLGYTPMHNVKPEVSNNYDFSFEHQFKGDVSVKLTPFYRKTQDQIQQFYLDQKTNFVSGLNVGRQTSEGVELEVDKGDFARNGIAGRFSFTYTNSYINYTKAPNGASVVDGINQIIQGYNAYTSFCATNPKDAKCGATVTAVAAAPCYTTAGAPDMTCAATSVANPYWKSSVQGLLDPNGSYPTFDTFPAGVGSAYNTFGAPYIATFLVQYKHDKFAITPALQFSGGQRYGSPANLPGVSPDTCTATTGASASGDPRYNFGAVGGQGYDATACADASQAIPDPYTGRFHGLGQFVAPSILSLHLQTSYELNKRVTLVGNFANVYNRCFGGSKSYWNTNGACGYGLLYGQSGGISPVGNIYNPGDNLQPFLTVPYGPNFNGTGAGSFPFNMYFEARIKI